MIFWNSAEISLVFANVNARSNLAGIIRVFGHVVRDLQRNHPTAARDVMRTTRVRSKVERSRACAPLTKTQVWDSGFFAHALFVPKNPNVMGFSGSVNGTTKNPGFLDFGFCQCKWAYCHKLTLKVVWHIWKTSFGWGGGGGGSWKEINSLSSFFCVHHPWTESYVWPGSCTVESLLISSRQIFQAAFIFKKWASQQVLHGLLWGPAFTGCICCISIAPFTQVGFAAAHTRAESVEGHSFHSSYSWPGASCSLVGIGSFARCCFAICCSSHNASVAVWGGCDSGWTAWRKLFLIVMWNYSLWWQTMKLLNSVLLICIVWSNWQIKKFLLKASEPMLWANKEI